jgi:hypothetical protein
VRAAADNACLPDEYGVPGWAQQRIDWLTFALADLFTDAEPPITLGAAAATMAPRPVLLITAGSGSNDCSPKLTHCGCWPKSGAVRHTDAHGVSRDPGGPRSLVARSGP